MDAQSPLEQSTAGTTGQRVPIIGSWPLIKRLLWAQGRSLRASFAKTRKESPLLLVVVATFIVGYLTLGFWLFEAALRYLYRFPLFGPLLAERLLYLIFGFFFIMLVFSNLIIGYTTLFKSPETHWFLSLPVRHRDVYRWKFMEALAVSSWGLVFLSAPMMAAYGVVHEVPWHFYPTVLASYLPFVVLPAVIGSKLVLLLVRVLSREWVKRGLIVGGIGALTWIMVGIQSPTVTEAVHMQEVVTFQLLLRHSQLATSNILPSAWLAQAVRSWSSEGMGAQGTFFLLLLLSYALMALLLGFTLAADRFYGSWTAAISSRAARRQLAMEQTRQRRQRGSVLDWMASRLRPLSPPMVALVVKDIRIFWRDPAQWSQFMVFFALLCIYVANLRNVSSEIRSPYWETLISFLNLAASSLTLSTLTTRFVYPQLSLEGRRVWILGLSPVGLGRVVWQKYWMSFLVSAGMTATLMWASANMLNLRPERIGYFVGAIILMSAALNGTAVGLGALFPNFKEENPSKIVSSFGGTLCLVVSFVYNTSFVALLAVPEFALLRKASPPFSAVAGAVSALTLSLLLAGVPLFLAHRRVKTLEM